MTHAPRILLAGDASLVVEFEDAIDPEINRRVHRLAHALEANPAPGLREAVPTYRSLLVHYDPVQLSCGEAKALIQEALRRCEELSLPEPKLVEILTAYGGEFGPDLEFVARHNHLSVEEVIRIHSGAAYTTYMLGFAPGFPYLGRLPDEIATPRLATPRKRVPAGSVGIAGSQTGVYPLATPGGWQLIGRTPVKLFDARRSPPTLLKPGDRVRFIPITVEKFTALVEEAHSGA